MIGRRLKTQHRFAHGETRRMIDVDLVDACRIDRRNRPGDGMFANPRRQLFATLGQQQLGIAQPAKAVAAIENHRRGHHRPKQRAAPNFIDASDH
jgi:hypothetical protein